jgi:UDP-N-acetyl-D-galactosamine dehydrogenase
MVHGSLFFGVAFKENCPDVRNTKVIDIINELEEYGMEVKVVDPVADKDDLWSEYRINPCQADEFSNIDAVILAVPHQEFKLIKLEDLRKMFRTLGHPKFGPMHEVAVTTEYNHRDIIQNDRVLIDVKGMFNRKEAENLGFLYWRL